MLSAYSPFHGADEKELFSNIINCPVDYPRFLSPSVKSLLNGLFERDPEKRYGGKQQSENIRLHPFFFEVNWEKLERGEVEPPFKPRVVSIREINILNDLKYFKNLIS